MEKRECCGNAPAPDEIAPAQPTKKVIIEPETDDDPVIVTRQAANTPSKVRRGKLANNSREARPTASGDRSLIRALGLKIGKIVIDPGHGGHDTGTIGPNGLLEKDLVLDVSRRLAKLLDTRMGADVLLTRSDDTFVPLETRTAVANQEQADLFVSVHANSSRDADARGVETYYLNFTSSPEALGSRRPRECSLRKINSRTARPGEEDCAKRKDRRVARVRLECAAGAAQQPVDARVPASATAA